PNRPTPAPRRPWTTGSASSDQPRSLSSVQAIQRRRHSALALNTNNARPTTAPALPQEPAGMRSAFAHRRVSVATRSSKDQSSPRT
ncbi:MAG: hypothetical protein QOC54_2464, partial [Baekduia sp.]|nr:hypothetical protein [Baekduia sp.]